MDRISIDKLVVFGKHGVFKEENVLGQKFEVSLIMYSDTRIAGRTDDLSASINYGEVSSLIQSFFQKNTYMLIERVAEELAELLLLTYAPLKKVDVKISKPWAPIGIPVDTVSVEISRSWHRAFVALGSNLGDKKAYLDQAVQKLKDDKLCKVIKVADYLETEPYGGVEQDSFLNSVLELQTLLYPEELLELLNRIEAEAQRERKVHWGPRTLDLDIIFYDNEVIDTERLTVPHIDMQNRDFVLKPMVQLAPYYRHPISMLTMKQMLDDLENKDFSGRENN
ncbi:MAG: 2-amino-4-hydroxy-6-hydroxymethyldihydropteridine diphosphokinase [Agathobacter sp.]|nr:2-amino-4-hydroxy-6-hydroxymethyldihydropteridine diphosphokinase [Agathobacter sp.]